MFRRINLSESGASLLQEIEDSVTENSEFSGFEIADYPVCKALIATRPIPSRTYSKLLARRMLLETAASPYPFRRTVKGGFLRPVGIALLAILIGILFLIGTPQGRGFAQEISAFFERERESEVPESSIIQPTPIVEPATLDTADHVLNFNLLYPAMIPDGYSLASFEVDPAGDYGILTFSGPTAESGVMNPQFTLRQQTAPFLELIGPEAEIVSIQVGSNLAEYVEGGWIYLSDDADAVEEKTFHWEKSFVPLQRLRWRIGDVFFELSFMGSDTQAGFLDLDDLIFIAENLE